MSGRFNARRENFYMAELFGRTVLYTPNLIDRKSIPKGMRMYEVRADDLGKPCELAYSLAGPKFGTIITSRYFPLRDGYRPIRKYGLSVRYDKTCTLKEFMRRFPPKNKIRQKFGE